MTQTGAKKKVLIAITKSNWGGAQRHVFDLATHIPKDAFDVTVVCGGEGVLATKLRASHIRTILIPKLGRDINMLSDFSSFRQLYTIIQDEKPDVLHLHSSKVGLLGALAGRCARVPRIVFTAHGWPFNEDRSFLQRVVLRALAYCTVILAHRTITVSRALAQPLRGRLARKVAVVHNSIAQSSYLHRDEARAALVRHSGKNEFWFGTIAELHPIKGLSYAIEAFSERATLFPNARYVIIGDGDERNRLEAQIQNSGHADKIHLAGFRENASQYLKAFDVCLLPSLSEGFSYVILEAGAAHLPVIATRTGGIPEIIDDKETGILIPARNSHALASAMAQVYNDATYRESLASTLHMRVSQKFSLKKMVESTVALYR